MWCQVHTCFNGAAVPQFQRNDLADTKGPLVAARTNFKADARSSQRRA
jgi:hypothetical protein